MTAFKSDFLNILRERGFIHQCSDFEGLDALAAKGQATAYVGYDCTAPSLHIGNYLTMMRSEEHTSELQSQSNLVCRLLLEKKKKIYKYILDIIKNDRLR